MTNHDTYKEIRKSRKKNGYGKNLFKVLFYLFLLAGLLSLISSFIFETYFALFISTGINTILFSFVFKFMESVILLLREIKEKP
jgi:hypothetical protein